MDGLEEGLRGGLQVSSFSEVTSQIFLVDFLLTSQRHLSRITALNDILKPICKTSDRHITQSLSIRYTYSQYFMIILYVLTTVQLL